MREASSFGHTYPGLLKELSGTTDCKLNSHAKAQKLVSKVRFSTADSFLPRNKGHRKHASNCPVNVPPPLLMYTILELGKCWETNVHRVYVNRGGGVLVWRLIDPWKTDQK